MGRDRQNILTPCSGVGLGLKAGNGRLWRRNDDFHIGKAQCDFVASDDAIIGSVRY